MSIETKRSWAETLPRYNSLSKLSRIMGTLENKRASFRNDEGSAGQVIFLDENHLNISKGDRLTRFTKKDGRWEDTTVDGEAFSDDELSALAEIAERDLK